MKIHNRRDCSGYQKSSPCLPKAGHSKTTGYSLAKINKEMDTKMDEKKTAKITQQ